MKSLLVIGAGGYGQLVKEIAEVSGYMKIEFLDDNNPEAKGKLADVEKVECEFDASIVAIGDPLVRKAIFNKLKKSVTIIHPSAVISPSAIIEDGCVIEANVVVNSNVEIRKSSFICAGAVINHDSVVGEFSQIDCNAVVACRSYVPDVFKVHSCMEFGKK